MHDEPPPLPLALRRALTWSGAVFAVALALVLLDVLAGLRLPGVLRPALPWVLVLSMAVAITVLAGALGTPKRPGRGGADGPDGRAPNADEPARPGSADRPAAPPPRGA